METLAHPVSLAEIKGKPGLAGIGLIRQPRLAVVKLSKAEFELIVALGNSYIEDEGGRSGEDH